MQHDVQEAKQVLRTLKDPKAADERKAALTKIWPILEARQVDIPQSAFLKAFVDAGGTEGLVGKLLEFFADRLKVQQRDAGVRYDLIDAVFALGGEDDLVRLLARVEALQRFMDTPEGADLLAAYKRAGNILKKEKWQGSEEQGIPQTGDEDPHAVPAEPESAEAVSEMALGSSIPTDAPPEEHRLADALDVAEPKAIKAIVDEDFTAAMDELATLRGPIDAFFDKVTVNDPDAETRKRRLNLLARFRDAVNAVADLSKVEG